MHQLRLETTSLAVVVLFLVLLRAPVVWAGEPSTRTVMHDFAWSDAPVELSLSVPCNSFVYASSSWPWSYASAWWPWGQTDTGCGSFFLYYEEEHYENLFHLATNLKERGKDVYVVLDPDLPVSTSTFLDLDYDEALRLDLEERLLETIANLSDMGLDGFVLGDEWPRGLNREEITVQVLARHNETYHTERGSWMRNDPSPGEKTVLAEWFYEHSIEAWNRIAQSIRGKHPDLCLGTNIDLVWEPDLSASDITHWRDSHWWALVDTSPYDFVVTHYLTRIGFREGDGQTEPQPSHFDSDRVSLLDRALEELLDPDSGPASGLEVYLLLGAHAAYPHVTTPMQMIQEWNTAMGHGDRLAGVGFFSFDLWRVDGGWIETVALGDTSISVPLKTDRVGTMRTLLDACSRSQCIGLGDVVLEPGSLSLWIGEETVLEITVASDGYQGDVSLKDLIIVPKSHPSDRLEYRWQSHLSGKGEPGGILGFVEAGGILEAGVRITVSPANLGRHMGQYECRAIVSPTPCSDSLWAKMTSNTIIIDVLPQNPINQVKLEPRSPYVRLGQEAKFGVRVDPGDYEGRLEYSIALHPAEIFNLSYPSEVVGYDSDGRPLFHLGSTVSGALLDVEVPFLLQMAQGADPIQEACLVWVKVCVTGVRSDIMPITVLPANQGDVVTGCTNRGIDVMLRSDHDDLAVEVGEEFELTLATRSYEWGNLSYEGNVSLDSVFIDAGPIEWPEGLVLDYYVTPIEDWDSLGFLASGDELESRIHARIFPEVRGEGKQDDFSKPIRLWLGVRVIASACRGMNHGVDGFGYLDLRVESNLVPITLLPRPTIEILWERRFEQQDERVTGLARSIDDGYIVAGASDSEGLLLLKIDGEGELIWRESYGTREMWDRATCILTDAQGSHLVAGARNGDQAFVMKVDREGKIVWQRTLNIQGDTPGFFPDTVQMALSCCSRSVLAARGSTIVEMDDDGSELRRLSLGEGWRVGCVMGVEDGLVVAGRNGEFGRVVKLDDAGGLEWDRELGDWHPFSVVGTQDGFILAGGMEQGFWYDFHETCVVKINRNSGKTWEYVFDGYTSQNLCHVADVCHGFAITWGGGVLLLDDQGHKVCEKPHAGERCLEIGGMVGSDDGGLVMTGRHGGDVRVVRLDSEGAVVWDRIHGDGTWIESVAASDGDCILAGYTQSFGAGLRDAYLLKIDGEGRDVWERAYGGKGWDSAQAAVSCSDGGLALAGHTIPPGSETSDLYLLRVDHEGSMVWGRAYDLGGWEEVTDMVRVQGGGFVVMGTSHNASGHEAYLVRIGLEGEVQWHKIYDYSVQSMIPTASGFILTGNTFVLKVDEYGDILWNRTYLGEGWQIADITQTTGGFLLVGGQRYYSSSRESVLVKIDEWGNMTWNRSYWGDFQRVAECIDGGFLVTSNTNPPYLLKVGPDGNRIWSTALGSRLGDITDAGEGSYVALGDDWAGEYVLRFHESVVESPVCILACVIVCCAARIRWLCLIRWTRYNTLSGYIHHSF